MLRNRRCFLQTAVAVPIALAPLCTRAAIPAQRPQPKLSREMEILLELLKRGARVEREPGNVTPEILVIMTTDVEKRAMAPPGHDYFQCTLIGIDPGLLFWNELERVWHALAGFTIGVERCLISPDRTNNIFGLRFSQPINRLALVSCADSLVTLLTNHDIERQPFINSLSRARDI